MKKAAKMAAHPKRVAEEEGFEPPVPFSTSVFKTGALNHSATPPVNFKSAHKGNCVLVKMKLQLKKNDSLKQ